VDASGQSHGGGHGPPATHTSEQAQWGGGGVVEASGQSQAHVSPGRQMGQAQMGGGGGVVEASGQSQTHVSPGRQTGQAQPTPGPVDPPPVEAVAGGLPELPDAVDPPDPLALPPPPSPMQTIPVVL